MINIVKYFKIAKFKRCWRRPSNIALQSYLFLPELITLNDLIWYALTVGSLRGTSGTFMVDSEGIEPSSKHMYNEIHSQA